MVKAERPGIEQPRTFLVYLNLLFHIGYFLAVLFYTASI